MTDLEIVRLCAQAMGEKLTWSEDCASWLGSGVLIEHNGIGRLVYDPLNDDAQAMALVKKFHIYINRDLEYADLWWCQPEDSLRVGATSSPNLNRAICECIAHRQVSIIKTE